MQNSTCSITGLGSRISIRLRSVSVLIFIGERDESIITPPQSGAVTGHSNVELDEFQMRLTLRFPPTLIELLHLLTAASGPQPSAPGSWQRIGGASPPRGRSSQPPRPRVMHEVLLARAAVKRSQRRPWAKY